MRSFKENKHVMRHKVVRGLGVEMGSTVASSCCCFVFSVSHQLDRVFSNSTTPRSNSFHISHNPLTICSQFPHPLTNFNQFLRFQRGRPCAGIDEREQFYSSPLVSQEEQPNKEVEESVEVLKNAAKTRRVAVEEVLSALSVIEKAKLDPSGFLDTLGGSKSPGRTWMLIFTAKNQLKGGRYFPFTAVQRFDTAAKRIENGVYLGALGCLTFEGRFSWKKRILAFIFELLRIKIGPLNPFEISFGRKEDTEPSNKDPFFIWFYVDEEIAVARGRSGGTAFWCRCRRVAYS